LIIIIIMYFISDLVREDTNNADAIYLKGLVHYEEGENSKAIQHFVEALRVHPDHEKSRLQLKVSLFGMNQSKMVHKHNNNNKNTTK